MLSKIAAISIQPGLSAASAASISSTFRQKDAPETMSVVIGAPQAKLSMVFGLTSQTRCYRAKVSTKIEALSTTKPINICMRLPGHSHMFLDSAPKPFSFPKTMVCVPMALNLEGSWLQGNKIMQEQCKVRSDRSQRCEVGFPTARFLQSRSSRPTLIYI